MSRPAVRSKVRRLFLDEMYDHLSRRDGRRVDLCRGVSTFDATRYVSWRQAEAAIARSTRYDDTIGRLELRRRIADWYKQFGADVPVSRVCVTQGAGEAIWLALNCLVSQGDEVVVPALGYPVYPGLILLAGGRCVFAPLAADLKLRPAAIGKVISRRTKAIIVNTPCNPFGVALSPADWRALLGHGLPLIADEVYADLVLDAAPGTLLQHSADHIVIGSFSKAFAMPGLRIGWLIAPEELIARAIDLKRLSSVTTSIPAQLLAEDILDCGHEIVEAHREFLRRRRERLLELWSADELLCVPEAGFFATVDVTRARTSGVAVARRLIHEYGVATVPGEDFGSWEGGVWQDESQPGSERGATKSRQFLRINYAMSDDDLAAGRDALERILR